jgi:hypothetical protein
MARDSKLVTLHIDTYEALRSLGTMRDTFDSVINRLIKDAQKWRVVENEFFEDFPRQVYFPNNATGGEAYEIMMQAMKKWFEEKGLLGTESAKS